MKNDFIPVIHRIPIAEHPNFFKIIPLGDAHYGSQEFNETRWHTVIKQIQDEPDTFCVLVGDLIDNGLRNSLTNIEDVYRQSICFMQVKLTYPCKEKGKTSDVKQRYTFSFAITHGAGGGQYIGSSANRVQNFGMAIEGIECLITGHTHKPVSFPVSKLVFTNGRVIRKQFVVAVTASFLDYGGYPVQKLMQPAAHVTTEIICSYADFKTNIRVLQ